VSHYIARRQAFAQAIEACEQLIRDYESPRYPPIFNAQEIEAVKTAILRIQCAEVRDDEERRATPSEGSLRE
jgi:hypothetical protein